MPSANSHRFHVYFRPTVGSGEEDSSDLENPTFQDEYDSDVFITPSRADPQIPVGLIKEILIRDERGLKLFKARTVMNDPAILLECSPALAPKVALLRLAVETPLMEELRSDGTFFIRLDATGELLSNLHARGEISSAATVEVVSKILASMESLHDNRVLLGLGGRPLLSFFLFDQRTSEVYLVDLTGLEASSTGIRFADEMGLVLRELGQLFPNVIINEDDDEEDDFLLNIPIRTLTEADLECDPSCDDYELGSGRTSRETSIDVTESENPHRLAVDSSELNNELLV